MARNILLTRDEAELLDDAMLNYVRTVSKDGRMFDLSDHLCEIWGLTPWRNRQDCQDLFENSEGQPLSS